MQLSEAIDKKFVMIIDPNCFDYGDPSSYISNFWREGLEIGVVAKNEAGKVTYKSFSVPKDPKFPEYFSTFVQIASEFSIPISAVLHSFGDSFMGADPNYSVAKSGGQEYTQFVCPSQPPYWRYLATAAREIGRYPVSRLIVDEHFYPRLDFCMCRRCRVEFRRLSSVDLDVTVEDLIRDEDLLFRWVDWRSELLSSSLGEVADAFRSERPNTPVNMVIPVDPELDWLTGATMHLGIDYEALNESMDGVIFSIMPFSPVYPMTHTEPWLQLVARIAAIRKKLSKVKVSLMIGGLEGEWDVTWFQDLAKEVNAERMYGKMSFGSLFNIKREIHRGIDARF